MRREAGYGRAFWGEVGGADGEPQAATGANRQTPVGEPQGGGADGEPLVGGADGEPLAGGADGVWREAGALFGDTSDVL